MRRVGDASALHACRGPRPGERRGSDVSVFPTCRGRRFPGPTRARTRRARAETRPRRRRGRPFRTGTWTRRDRCRANANATLRPKGRSRRGGGLRGRAHRLVVPRARSGSFARGGRAGSVAVEGAVEDARARFRAGVVVAVRFRCADDVGVFLLGERGVGARGGSFGRGAVAGFGGTETTRTRARRGRRSGWCVPRVHARIVDSRFGCRVRSHRRGGWGAGRGRARARASDGSFPRGAQPRARVDARGKGVERRGDARPRHPRAHDRDREKRIARSRRDRNGGLFDGTRDGCARLGTCASRRLFVW